MAGLGVLLEAKTHLRKTPQILNKITILRTSTTAPLPPSSPPTDASAMRLPSSFLQACFLCHQPLSQSKDIYMYRGDRAFCSEECRCRQIYMDEETGRRENCASAAKTASSASRRSGKKGRAAPAGGFVQ